MKKLTVLILAMVSWSACAKDDPEPCSVAYDVVYFDMDGTLLAGNGKIRPDSLDAIKEFKRCGGHVGIASGRSLAQVAAHLSDVDPDLPLVLNNGAVVYSSDGRQVLWTNGLDAKQARQVVQAASQITGVEGVVINELDRIVVDRNDKDFIAFLSKSKMSNVAVNLTLADTYDGNAMRVMLVVTAGTAEKVAENLRQAIDRQGSLQVLVTSGRTVEVVSATTDKGTAILRVLELRNIAVERSLAFGDGENDAGMLSRVGHGVAMKNCKKVTCEAADETIGHHDSDAISSFLRQKAVVRGLSATEPE